MSHPHPHPERTCYYPAAADIHQLGLVWDRNLDGEPGYEVTTDGMEVADDTLFININREPKDNPADPKNGVSGGIMALDANSGEPIWEFYSEVKLVGPAVAEGTVYVSEHHGRRLLALDAETGRVEWTFDAGRAVGLFHPTVSGDQVFVSKVAERRILPGISGSIICVDKNRGSEVWSQDNQTRSLTVTDDYVFAVTFESEDVVALERDTGREAWRLEFPELRIGGWLVYSDERLFGGTLGGSVICINVATQTKSWRESLNEGASTMPTVGGETVLVGTTDENEPGGLYAFDACRGNRLWETSIEDGVSSQPVLTERTIYFLTDGGRFCAVDKSSGEVHYSLKVSNAHGTWGSIAFNELGIYACTVDLVYRFGSATDSDTTDVYKPDLSYDQKQPGNRPDYCGYCGASLNLYESVSYCPECGEQIEY
jgi:outer membrane protein assembly factor BamB